MKQTTVFLTSLVLASPALGHHSVVAFYDEDRTTEIEGTVTEVFWRNPHTGFTIEVVNAEGVVEEWITEGSPTSALVRRGFYRDTVNVGDRVRYIGRASRRGERMIFGGAPSHLLLPGGEEVRLGPPLPLEGGRELGSAARLRHQVISGTRLGAWRGIHSSSTRHRLTGRTSIKTAGR